LNARTVAIRGLWIIACLITSAGVALSSNGEGVIVLHALGFNASTACSYPQSNGFNCGGSGAQTQVAPNTDLSVYVYTYRADSLAGIAVRFDWDPSWTLLFWQGNCQPGSVEAVTPTQSGGSLVVAFNCALAPASPGLIPLGKLNIRSGTSGTFLHVGNAIGPDGTAVISCSGVTNAIPSGQWGSIGVGTAGVDGCDIIPGGWGGGDDMF
jgi:hypothetical protein